MKDLKIKSKSINVWFSRDNIRELVAPRFVQSTYIPHSNFKSNYSLKWYKEGRVEEHKALAWEVTYYPLVLSKKACDRILMVARV